MHPCRNRSITVLYCLNFSHKLMLTGNHKFLSQGDTVLTVVLPRTIAFFSVISLYDCIITSENCNHQNYKSRCIYQVLKFPNWSPYCYMCTQVHVFSGPSQLDNPVTCKNIKCYSHVQIIHWIKSFYNLFSFTVLKKKLRARESNKVILKHSIIIILLLLNLY